MFGTRTVRHAVWSNGKRKVTGCWEYSGILDKYDIWLDSTIGDRTHHIVDGASPNGPEWKGWKIVKSIQKTIDNTADSDTTDP